MKFGGSNFDGFPDNQLFQNCRFWCILRMDYGWNAAGGIQDARFATTENGCQYKNIMLLCTGSIHE